MNLKLQLLLMNRRRLIPALLAILLLLAPAMVPAQTTDGAAPPAGADAREVAIDFSDVEIGVFIKFISELTGRNFIIDQKVKGRVTVISPSRISVAEAYQVFQSVLEVHGFTTVDAGRVTKIVPAGEARTKRVDTLSPGAETASGDRLITQIVPLRFANSVELQKLLKPLVAPASVVLGYGPSNTLIITDTASNIQRLLTIIEAVDVIGAGQIVAVVPLKHALAKDMEATLRAVFQTDAPPRGGGSTSGITFVRDERTNTIVVVGSEEHIERARSLIDSLDRMLPEGGDRIHVVYLEYAKAEELASVLQNVQQQGQEGKAAQPGASVISENVTITADQATNSLVVNADRSDFQAVEAIIAKLDIPRAMVYIESVILEVDVSKDFELGVQWQGAGSLTIDGKPGAVGGGYSGGDRGTQFGDLDNFANFGGEAGLPAGAAIGIFTEEVEIAGVRFTNLSAIVNAFKKDKDVHIISTPQILTTDNTEAEIFVGKNVPFQTTTSTTDNDTFNSFEYRDVGTTLKITPQITKESLVRLAIEQEISALESTTDFRPTTLNRSLSTTVLVRDRSTVVIGGLIGENSSVTEYKIPFLGDIPMLGWLFRSEGKTSERTNLYVFLRPRVVAQPLDAQALYEEKQQAIDTINEGRIKLFDDPEHRPTPPATPAPDDRPASDAGPEPYSNLPEPAPSPQSTAEGPPPPALRDLAVEAPLVGGFGYGIPAERKP